MEISQSTIDQHLAALKEMQTLIARKNYNTVKFKTICALHKCSVILPYAAAEIGLFAKVGRGLFIIKVKDLTPIHARQVIEHIDKVAREGKEARKQRFKDTKRKYTKKPPTAAIKPAPSKAFPPAPTLSFDEVFGTKPKKPTRIFSFAWGLIKFNY